MQITMDDLMACRDAAKATEQMRERIMRLESSLEKVTPTYSADSTRGGSEQNPREEKLARLADWREELLDELARYKNKADIVWAACAVLPGTQQRIMRLRYIDGKSWREVARAEKYEESWIFEQHAEALKKLGVKKNGVNKAARRS